MVLRSRASIAALSLCGLACGAAPEPRPVAAPAATITAPAPVAATPASAAASAPASAPAKVPASFEEEAREILRELIAVDTSHGNETKALQPVLERLKAAGVNGQIYEMTAGRGNLIARLKGNGTKKPLLLIAHIDVVPVEGQPWSVAPFKPIEKDGFLWGRGVGDDKSMAAAFTATVLELARKKTPLSRDVILALTAGEETGGKEGARWLASQRRELIDAEVALNEGGSIVTSPDSSDVQLVGIQYSEKSYQSYRLIARGGGGHSSVPQPGDDPAAELARAIVKVSDYRFPAKVIPSVKGWLAAQGTWESGAKATALRNAAASAPVIHPADDKILSADRQFNALIRTTCVTTMLSGSPQDNVLPTTAEAKVNCRILPDETREQTQATLVKLIANPKIEIQPLQDNGVGPSSPAEGEIPAILEKVAHESFPKAKVVGVMQTGATDSRHLRNAGIPSYGIASAPTSGDESRAGRGAHGPDERRPTKWLGPGARFLRDVVLAVAR